MHRRWIVCPETAYKILLGYFILLMIGSWIDFEWNEVFDFPKCDHDHDDYAAAHRIKWALIEDAYVKQWQQCVHFGKWVTADESRLARWHHSACTIGPDPKPI